MPLYSTSNTPQQNLTLLAANPYPGRVLAMGYVGDVAVQAYAIGGRSEDSRNRILVLQDNIISTESFDKTRTVIQPELTIYDAMRCVSSTHIASNGDQTNTAVQYLRCGRNFEEAMNARSYEPDDPNFTPRISGYIDIGQQGGQPKFGLSLIKKAINSDDSERYFYTENSPEINLQSGIGYALHTYKGNDSPLLAFDEIPFIIPIIADAQKMAELLWKHLEKSTRVAVAAKTITPDGVTAFYIINTH